MLTSTAISVHCVQSLDRKEANCSSWLQVTSSASQGFCPLSAWVEPPNSRIKIMDWIELSGIAWPSSPISPAGRSSEQWSRSRSTSIWLSPASRDAFQRESTVVGLVSHEAWLKRSMWVSHIDRGPGLRLQRVLSSGASAASCDHHLLVEVSWNGRHLVDVNLLDLTRLGASRVRRRIFHLEINGNDLLSTAICHHLLLVGIKKNGEDQVTCNFS